ncbi:hypothetical protein HDU97_008068 [Phlyctochytrium planicorne]|nr:hypothetical protein HDU97_008068 [Phlyctochytrium planicorne]
MGILIHELPIAPKRTHPHYDLLLKARALHAQALICAPHPDLVNLVSDLNEFFSSSWCKVAASLGQAASKRKRDEEGEDLEDVEQPQRGGAGMNAQNNQSQNDDEVGASTQQIPGALEANTFFRTYRRLRPRFMEMEAPPSHLPVAAEPSLSQRLQTSALQAQLIRRQLSHRRDRVVAVIALQLFVITTIATVTNITAITHVTAITAI